MLSDTTPAAQRVYEQAIARLTPDERVAITMEMIAVTDDLLRAGIRFRHPGVTGEELAYQLLRAKYSPDLAGRVYGTAMVTLADAFRTVRRALDRASVTYAIGGSWASSIHGEPRHTNGIDFVTDLDAGRLRPFLHALGPGFYFDEDTALEALNNGRSFNVIHQALGYKFDFFPAIDSYGDAELKRRQAVPLPGLDTELVPIISAEDTILAKLRWYRAGDEASDRQWRDIAGIFAASGEQLDRAYLERWARAMGLMDLYERAMR